MHECRLRVRYVGMEPSFSKPLASPRLAPCTLQFPRYMHAAQSDHRACSNKGISACSNKGHAATPLTTDVSGACTLPAAQWRSSMVRVAPMSLTSPRRVSNARHTSHLPTPPWFLASSVLLRHAQQSSGQPKRSDTAKGPTHANDTAGKSATSWSSSPSRMHTAVSLMGRWWCSRMERWVGERRRYEADRSCTYNTPSPVSAGCTHLPATTCRTPTTRCNGRRMAGKERGSCRPSTRTTT